MNEFLLYRCSCRVQVLTFKSQTFSNVKCERQKVNLGRLLGWSRVDVAMGGCRMVEGSRRRERVSRGEMGGWWE